MKTNYRVLDQSKSLLVKVNLQEFFSNVVSQKKIFLTEETLCDPLKNNFKNEHLKTNQNAFH